MVNGTVQPKSEHQDCRLKASDGSLSRTGQLTYPERFEYLVLHKYVDASLATKYNPFEVEQLYLFLKEKGFTFDSKREETEFRLKYASASKDGVFVEEIEDRLLVTALALADGDSINALRLCEAMVHRFFLPSPILLAIAGRNGWQEAYKNVYQEHLDSSISCKPPLAVFSLKRMEDVGELELCVDTSVRTLCHLSRLLEIPLSKEVVVGVEAPFGLTMQEQAQFDLLRYHIKKADNRIALEAKDDAMGSGIMLTPAQLERADWVELGVSILKHGYCHQYKCLRTPEYVPFTMSPDVDIKCW